MGASRKLQGEIDRVLKKVQEGVDVFDSIWNKVYDTDNANQKEKFEADLKKEIKKLQRYRDQIKAWIQSSEIKDKKVSASYEQALMDARKQIEREMERFKICEKETKTKAFSKEGLGQQPKTDPREKAKSETRDWLNNVVGELESQVDNFEAEIEGLSVKKGKTRPPRLAHLEKSIARHKAHIIKLELILRLLDNDELSPEQVNDVKDFLDDYVERNQDDFDDFNEVDELYISLPLERVESLEDLVTIGPPGLVKGSSPLDPVEEITSEDNISETVARTLSSRITAVSSLSLTSPGSLPISTTANVSSHNFSGPPTSPAVLQSSGSVRAVLENVDVLVSSPTPFSNYSKEEEIINMPVHRSSPTISDAGLARGIGRGSLPCQTSLPNTSLGTTSLIANNVTPVDIPSVSETAKKNILGADERLGTSGMIQSLVPPLSSRIMIPQASKTSDVAVPADLSNAGDTTGISGRGFSPSVVPNVQWRPGSSFQNQNDMGQVRGRTEIEPEQREKFLQRFQHVQQQGHSTQHGISSSVSSNHNKQFTAQQQNPLLQQFTSYSSSASPQVGLGLGVTTSNLNPVTCTSIQQHPNSIHQHSSQQAALLLGQKNTDALSVKLEEQHQLPQPNQNLGAGSVAECCVGLGPAKNHIIEGDLKYSYTMDTPTGGLSSSLTEPTHVSREITFSPGEPLPSILPSGNLGVIGRRSHSDLGAIGDNLSGLGTNPGGTHDQFYNLQMLEAAYSKLPQPKDSERAKHYSPRHPAVTPACYPQGQAPIVNNPAFWERLGLETLGTDTLFFSFYYQQNTYQQYLAAKELKKHSWRYHKKFNTWFQRHEEPKVATDEYEQGTYVYFDFHLDNDDMQHGWCQRIKTDFTFEYNHLEDELT